MTHICDTRPRWVKVSKTPSSWWRHQMETFPRYWSFVRGIHRSSVNSPHKGQWRGALVLYLIFAWINAWVNNREAGDLRRHRTHYDVTVIMKKRVDFLYIKLCSHYLLSIYLSFLSTTRVNDDNDCIIYDLTTTEMEHIYFYTLNNCIKSFCLQTSLVLTCPCINVYLQRVMHIIAQLTVHYNILKRGNVCFYITLGHPN